MRKLAIIREIKELIPIKGKDRIELAIIDGWSVITQKGEYEVGNKTVYCEIDSILPEKPEFEFLRKRKFRIKTLKMGGVISQGICFPLSILPEGEYNLGEDVTDLIGIKKYESSSDKEDSERIEKNKIKNPILKYLLRYKIIRKLMLPKKNNKGFPTFISKTNEERYQNISHILNNKDIKWTVREKVDGQSGTFCVKRKKSILPFIKDKYEYIVCSRNTRLLIKNMSKSYWKVSEKYNIEYVLKDLLNSYFIGEEWLAIQGECIDTKVQGNMYKVDEAELYVFNLITPSGKWGCKVSEDLLKPYNIKWCPLVAENYTLPDTTKEIDEFATGKSKLYDTLREGVVFRNYSKNMSFKAVSSTYLLKNDK
jgi:hypothetical protein